MLLAQALPKPSNPTRSQRGHLFRPAPKPRDWTPSPFVVECLKRIPERAHKFAVDLGCGYGRHARLLASSGFTVFALDLDQRALRALPSRAPRIQGQLSLGSIHPIVANATQALPL